MIFALDKSSSPPAWNVPGWPALPRAAPGHGHRVQPPQAHHLPAPAAAAHPPAAAAHPGARDVAGEQRAATAVAAVHLR